MIGALLNDSGGNIGTIIASVITACFGVWIVLQNQRLAKSTKTNHGKTIGQHVESAAVDAAEAKIAAQLVALQLAEYKAEQAASSLVEHALVQSYVDADLQAHQELRALIIQVATQRPA